MATELENAIASRDMWIEAQTALATSQSYTVEENDSRYTVTRADLATVLKMIQYWKSEVKRLSSSRRRGGFGIV